jgi:histidyl-tRNA synthetase
MFQAVRGTNDLLPPQLATFRTIEHKAHQLAEQYGFSEIRTPLFEKADLFVRGLGVMAGIVERELWTFHDKHGQKLALRADMTPCVVRAYQQHRMGKDSQQATKLCYVGPVFLLGKEGDQPSRQAHQFGVEVLGNDSPALDAELICMALEFCERIGLTDVKSDLNSLGCDRCRPAYYDALREFFAARQNELCNTCKRKYRTHPTWVLSCPESGCQALANLSPTILGYLCQDCKSHFNALKHLLQELELETAFNPRVVRDLEYYNRTVFRLTVNGQTIGVGGRYDGLVEQLGGSETPAAGFALYLEELVSLLNPVENQPEEVDFLFVPEGPEAVKALLPTALKLRRGGARVEILYHNPAQLPEARWTVRLAEANALRGQVEIQEQDSRQQEKCGVERLLARLQHMLGQGQSDGEGRGPRRRLNRLRNKERDHRDRDHRDRDHRRVAEESTANAGQNGAEMERDDLEEAEVGEESGGRRRKRRRRRRGEPDDSGHSSEGVAAVADGGREERDREGREREGRDNHRERGDREHVREGREQRDGRGGERDRGERSERDRGDRGERERGERSDRERGDRDRDNRDNRDNREGGRDNREGGRDGWDSRGGNRNQGGRRGENRQDSRPEPRQEQPVKAFIPSLVLGSGPVTVKSTPARDGAVASRALTPSRSAEREPAASAAALGNLNWSIKTGPNGPAEHDDDEPQGQDRAPRRRMSRRGR